jgi:hypothetical protein
MQGRAGAARRIELLGTLGRVLVLGAFAVAFASILHRAAEAREPVANAKTREIANKARPAQGAGHGSGPRYSGAPPTQRRARVRLGYAW